MMEDKMGAPSGGGRNGAVEGHSRAANDTQENTPNGGGSQGFDFAEFENLGLKPNGGAAPISRVVAFWIYTNEHGAPLYKVERLEDGTLGANGKPKKTFRQSKADGRGGWLPGMDGVRRVPYRLPELIAAIAAGEVIYVLEGEKCVDLAIKELGVCATTNSGGASTWPADLNSWFHGADVVPVPDGNAIGQTHAFRVARGLSGIAKRIRIASLPGLGEKDDIEQWIAGGGTKEALLGLAEQAPDYVAPPPVEEIAGTAQEREPWSQVDEDRVRDALRFIPADCDRNEEWVPILMAIHWTGWPCARDIAEEWSRSCPERYDPVTFENTWKSFHADGQGGKVKTLGSLYRIAEDNGWSPAIPDFSEFADCEQVFASPGESAGGAGDAKSEGQGASCGATDAKAKDGEINLTPFVYRDPRLIPKRKWLYGHHFIRKYLSLTLASGGTGKSSLLLVECIAMATGKALLGVSVRKPLRIAYWNGEDPPEEIELRIAAILHHFGIKPEDLDDRLFVDSGHTLPIKVVQMEKGTLAVTENAKAVARALFRNKIDVLVLDPFVTTHDVSENDNVAINFVASTYRQMAIATNCSVELLHHIRKQGSGGRDEVTADDGRGASSLKDAARCVRVLSTMTDKEAADLGFAEGNERRRYFRADSGGKVNMTKAVDDAEWYRIESVYLPENPGDIDEFEEDQSVGVATAWVKPDSFDGLDSTALIVIQNAIAAGTPGGGQWAQDIRSSDWVGNAIAGALNVDPTETTQKARIKKMIKAWLKNSCLKVEIGINPKTRHTRPNIILGTGQW